MARAIKGKIMITRKIMH